LCGGDFRHYEEIQTKPFIEVLTMCANVQHKNRVAFSEQQAAKRKAEAQSKIRRR